MKKIFIAISILFLTTLLHAKDFILPDFNYDFQTVKSCIENNYNITYEKKHKVYDISEEDLLFFGASVEKAFFQNYGDGKYAYTFVFEDMNINEWTTYVLLLIYYYDIFDYRLGDDNIHPFIDTDTYQVSFQFEEITTGTKNRKTLIIVRASK